MGGQGQAREQVQGLSAGLPEAPAGPPARAKAVQKRRERERMPAVCRRSLGESFLWAYCVPQLGLPE